MLKLLLDIPIRLRFLLGFVACAGSMAFALYLEHFQHLAPCALCVLQRVAMVATGLIFLIASLHNPRDWGRPIYAVLAAVAASAGAVIAGRHVWLQSLPPELVPACGPPLEHLMKIMPWSDALAFVLKGEGNCAVIDAQWLGISLPGWTLVGFVLLVLWSIYCMLPSRGGTR